MRIALTITILCQYTDLSTYSCMDLPTCLDLPTGSRHIDLTSHTRPRQGIPCSNPAGITANTSSEGTEKLGPVMGAHSGWGASCALEPWLGWHTKSDKKGPGGHEARPAGPFRTLHLVGLRDMVPESATTNQMRSEGSDEENIRQEVKLHKQGSLNDWMSSGACGKEDSAHDTHPQLTRAKISALTRAHTMAHNEPPECSGRALFCTHSHGSIKGHRLCRSLAKGRPGGSSQMPRFHGHIRQMEHGRRSTVPELRHLRRILDTPKSS